MIVHGNDWLFVHNPKCAGNSVRSILGKGVEKTPDHSHAGLRDLQDLAANKWTFAFVRNPYARMVSGYEFFRKKLEGSQGQWDYVNNIRDCYKPFKEWLMESEVWEGNFRLGEIQPFQKRSQSYYITLDDKNIATDFVGKVENFNQDMRTVCLQINVPYRDTIMNTTEHSHYSKYYDDESREFIEKWFKWDLETFNYEF